MVNCFLGDIKIMIKYYFYEVFDQTNKSLGFVFGQDFPEARNAAEILYGNGVFLKTVDEETL